MQEQTHSYKFMKYLPKETCEYLVFLGCLAESGIWSYETNSGRYYTPAPKPWMDEVTPAFSLEDMLRKDNAAKIASAKSFAFPDEYTLQYFREDAFSIIDKYPGTWPEEVARLIKSTNQPEA